MDVSNLKRPDSRRCRRRLWREAGGGAGGLCTPPAVVPSTRAGLDSDSDEHYMVMHRSWDGLNKWVPKVQIGQFEIDTWYSSPYTPLLLGASFSYDCLGPDNL